MYKDKTFGVCKFLTSYFLIFQQGTLLIIFDTKHSAMVITRENV